ncbi:uncharacterized protein LOC135393332 isoform X2 [Ornithodoros turicata]|uniref:uncharacterized protein LOC135393332 isoform X2 n=1 Tax=Ornithodoros turicata TaxID=34597 RepID=UPI003139F36B
MCMSWCLLAALCTGLAFAQDAQEQPVCDRELSRIAQCFPKHVPELMELRRGSVRYLRSGLLTGSRGMSLEAACPSTSSATTLTVLLPLEGTAQISLPTLRNIQVFFDGTARVVANVSVTNETSPKVNGVAVDKVSLNDFEHGASVQNNTRARKFVETITKLVLKRGLEANLAAYFKYALLKAIADGQQEQDRALILEKRVFVYKLLDKIAKTRL